MIIMKMIIIITIIMMFLPGSALAEYAIILSIYTLELDKREYQINQASQMMKMMIYGNKNISIPSSSSSVIKIWRYGVDTCYAVS